MIISNYKKNLVETRLKAAYSIINQMMYNSIAENGESINWTYPIRGNSNYTEAEFFKTYLAKYIQITAICDKAASSSNNKLCRIHNSENVETASGSSINFSNLGENSPKYLLPNGTGFYIDTIWGLNVTDKDFGGEYIIFIVDLNINTNKALLGRDIFLLHYMKENEKLQSSRYMDWPNHSRSCSKLNQNRSQVINECKSGSLGTAGGGYDAGCTTLIMCNNWQIPDDYPVKF